MQPIGTVRLQNWPIFRPPLLSAEVLCTSPLPTNIGQSMQSQSAMTEIPLPNLAGTFLHKPVFRHLFFKSNESKSMCVQIFNFQN